MRRGIEILLTAVLIAVLALSLYLQLWGLPAGARAVARTFPEVESLVVPSIVWGILAMACWEAVAILGLRVIILVRRDNFAASALPLLRAMVFSFVAFFLLVAMAFIALGVMGYLTAGVMLGLVAGGLIALCGASSIGLSLAVRR